MGVVIPKVNNYAINSQLSRNQSSLPRIVVIDSRTKGQFMKTFDLSGTSSREDKIGQQTKGTRHTFINDIDAIAYGVEAWFEENTDCSKGVAETTAEIARKLGVPEDEIRRWATRRSAFNTEKVKQVKSLLRRLGVSSPGGGLKTGDIKWGNLG